MMHEAIVQISVSESIEKVWEYWTNPKHIVNWNFATPEWHCPSAEHDLSIGGKLSYHMAAKDGSIAFDYQGIYTSIIPNELIEHTIDDGRKVSVRFSKENGVVKIVETFEVEDENTIDMQRQGWQSILINFKEYVESK